MRYQIFGFFSGLNELLNICFTRAVNASLVCIDVWSRYDPLVHFISYDNLNDILTQYCTDLLLYPFALGPKNTYSKTLICNIYSIEGNPRLVSLYVLEIVSIGYSVYRTLRTATY